MEPWVTRSTIRGNHAYYIGGGIFAGGEELRLVNCLIADNSVEMFYAGGVYAAATTSLNSTIAGNTARSDAGIRATNATLTNCVLGQNRATTSGANDLRVSGSLTITHSAATLQYSGSGILVGGGTLTPDSTGVYTFDPMFIDPDGPDNNPATWGDNNYRLSPRSPAMDADVLGAGLSILDLDGNARYLTGIVGRPAALDLRCYESQLTLCPADLDANQAVTIDDLLDFLHAFETGDALADLTTDGLTPFPDGAVTVEDLLFLLAKFEDGC